MRYWHCAVCGYFKTRVVMGEPYLAPWHEHGRRGRVSILQLRPEEFYGHAESVHAPTFGNPYEFEESQMKTCETCQGTGRVEEPLKVGDIVESIQSRSLSIVTSAQPVGGSLQTVYISGPRRGLGDTWFCPQRSLKRVHGHIHIDR